MTIVCIAGMHRSGTSMVTRLLNLCGVYLGNASDLLPPDPDNLEGYWENGQFMSLNDEILSALGGGWDYPPVVYDLWEQSKRFSDIQDRALKTIQSFSDQEHWGWKDPRNSLTLPFWRELIPSMKVVICLRNPYEVVNSLIKRNYFSPALGFNLWLEYNQRILTHIEPKNRIITHYDSYFQDPYSELVRILKFLEMNVPEEQIRESINTVSIPLRHNRSTLHNLMVESPLKVINLYQKMYAQTGTAIQLTREIKTEIQTPFAQNFQSDDDRKKTIKSLTTQIEKKETALLQMQAQAAQKEQELAEIINSKAWKLSLLFRRIRVLIVPPDSHRARILMQLINIVDLSIKKIRRRNRKLLLMGEDLALMKSSKLFDEVWYLTNNPDVAQAKVDPFFHYLNYGGFEGRDPGPNFSVNWYLYQYKDVKEVGIHPLIHYLKYGKNEGRQPKPDPIIVYQMGKVSAESIQKALQKAYKTLKINVPVYHTFLLNGFDQQRYNLTREENLWDTATRLAPLEQSKSIRKLIDNDSAQHWKLITLIRDPVAHNIIMFFETLTEYIPDWHERYINGKLDMDELQSLFLHVSSWYSGIAHWFDTQLKPVPAFDINVYETPFPHEIGYQIYPGISQASLLLIRFENLSNCVEEAMHEFLGLENFNLNNANPEVEIEQKDYADLYHAFEKLSLPTEYVKNVYATQYSRHFYTDAELDLFTKRWTKKENSASITSKEQSVKEIATQVAEKDMALLRTQAQLAKKDLMLTKKNLMLTKKNENLLQMHTQLTEKERTIAEITNSSTWKLASFLQESRRLFISPLNNRLQTLLTLINVFTSKQNDKDQKQNQATTSTESPNPPKVDDDKQAITKDEFDEHFYLLQYPDVLNSGIDPYQHYRQFGKPEGRLGSLPKPELQKGLIEFDASKDTILIVNHEASRTGAPILGFNLAQGMQKKYNVVSLLLGDGSIAEYFLNVSAIVVKLFQARGNPITANYVIKQLTELYEFKFALVNSIESRVVLPMLAQRFIPTITLIHEFAAYTRPREAFIDVLLWSHQIIFSTLMTHENAISEHPKLNDYSFHILPQGLCVVPSKESDVASAEEEIKVINILRPENLPANTIVILGVGSVHIRKGVDLFLECAARVVDAGYGKHSHFVWIGNGFNPEKDMNYSVYLLEQIRRSGLEQYVSLMGEISNIEAAYQATDILLLTSRLDPLPNVAIDAMMRKLPIICFEKSTGIADILIANGLSEECVAPYLDTMKMSDKIIAFAKSTSLRQKVGEQLRQVALKEFDMANYIAQIEKIGLDSNKTVAQEKTDVLEIAQSKFARLDFFLSPDMNMLTDDAISYYVRKWARGLRRRKLFPGFHPGIFAEQSGLCPSDGDPLANYLRAEQPVGAWRYDVITSEEEAQPLPSNVRVALHLHIYYPDLLMNILNRLNKNRIKPDLFVSVPTDSVLKEVKNVLTQTYSGKLIETQVVPNRGRDIGPFLTAFGKTFVDNYDVIGHIHTKKTVDVKHEQMGKDWFTFLLENLLGGKSNMADIILGNLANNPSIGLVFPDDPNIVDWGQNRSYAQSLGKRLGIDSLPENIVFPVGTMFWARVESLLPLFNLGLNWDDYPPEPLPYDGSMLHAFERLLPLVVSSKGFRSVTTNVIAITR